ncbi:phage virion morphogenesis protein [Shewanella baltica]|uniref:phage virion morphogenesis protein n=1 Tax=Shewanella baltica TaxID=62322 RepID=UPI00217E09DE|nr:phage virion morphogenesis protein [Shewanella baltica]
MRCKKAPDGLAFEARKPQPIWAKCIGTIKRKLMFQKSIRQKYLKTEYSASAASVGFTGGGDFPRSDRASIRA